MASNKEFAVNWKNHTTHMKEAFESLFDANEFVDVTLYCEGHKIGAHKMVLSACSPYFRNIFKDVPCQHHVIVLNNVEFAIMENLIRFMYHGEVSVHNSKLNLFLQTAQMLEISGLTDAARGLNEPAEEAVEPPAETVTKRKRDSDSPAEVQRVAKTPRPDPAPAEPEPPEHIGLMDVKCEPDELVDAFDPLEDPLQHDSSSHEYLQEAQYLTEEDECITRGKVTKEIKLWDEFESYEEFLKVLFEFTSGKSVSFYKRETQSIAEAKKKTGRYLNPKLKYYQFKYACTKRGKAEYKPYPGMGQRCNRSSTRKDGCKAHITLRASLCGTKLQIIGIENRHNHDIRKVCM